jgi:hypothetical protein
MYMVIWHLSKEDLVDIKAVWGSALHSLFLAAAWVTDSIVTYLSTFLPNSGFE